jgi:putative glutamine amidotransferase
MPTLPPVAVTATTEIIREVLRVRVNAAYATAIRGAGLLPLVLPVLDPADADAALDGVAGLVLTGGEDVSPGRYGSAPHPALGDTHDGRDGFEIALVHAARARALPTLAICRGIQILNAALGGTLVQDIPSQIGTTIGHDDDTPRDARSHEITIDAGSLIARAVGAEHVTVNSFHHQSVDRVADGMRVTARSPDGVIEGMESTDDAWWVMAVQWHPEEMTDSPEPWDRGLFKAFARKLGA